MWEYELLEDKSGYCVKKFCNSMEVESVCVPKEYNGLPVTKIGSEAFQGQNKITTIAILEGLTEIEEFAFCGCNNLRMITLPESVKKIAKNAFRHCKALRVVEIPISVEITEKFIFDANTTVVRIGKLEENKRYYMKEKEIEEIQKTKRKKKGKEVKKEINKEILYITKTAALMEFGRYWESNEGKEGTVFQILSVVPRIAGSYFCENHCGEMIKEEIIVPKGEMIQLHFALKLNPESGEYRINDEYRLEAYEEKEEIIVTWYGHRHNSIIL